MITKNSRKKTSPIEALKQGSFTAVKGIDETAAHLSVDTVSYTKNFDIDTDGGLILRKPIVCVEELPVLNIDGFETLTEVIYAGYLYDKEYLLIIRKEDSLQWLGIFKNGTPATLRLCWNSWEDYAEHNTAPDTAFSGFYNISNIDFTKVSAVNTATSTVFTGCFVNIAANDFRRVGATYINETDTDLFYTNLYDVTEPSGSVYKPRTLILTKSTALDKTFDLKIVTPDITTIQSADTLALDPNLDLDNPYSIRDAYNTSAPTVKNIIPYIPTYSVGGKTVPSLDVISSVSETVDTQHTVTAPNVLISYEPTDAYGLSQKADVSYTEGSGRFGWSFPPKPLPNDFVSSYHINTALCRDFKISGALNFWVYVQSELGQAYSEGYVCFRVGELVSTSVLTAISGDVSLETAPFADRPDMDYVTNIRTSFAGDIDNKLSVGSPSVISLLENLPSSCLSRMFLQFENNSYNDTVITNDVHGLGSHVTITVLKNAPNSLALYAPVGYVFTVTFTYPKHATGYTWERAQYLFEHIEEVE